MDLATLAQLRDCAIKVTRVIEVPTPIAAGELLTFSDFGKTVWDTDVAFKTWNFQANFKPNHLTPFVRSTNGTVNWTQKPRIVRFPIERELCEVKIEAATAKFWGRQGIIDLYDEQLRAKVVAWDQRVENLLVYGNPQLGIAGLLQGSGIPISYEAFDFKAAAAAAPQTVLNTLLKMINSIAINSKMRYQPDVVGLPLNFWNLLNSTTISGQNTASVLQILNERLDAGFGTGASKPRRIIAIPTLDNTQSMIVLPSDPELVGAAVYPLEEVTMGADATGVNSTHIAGTAGVITTHPQSAIIYQINY